MHRYFILFYSGPTIVGNTPLIQTDGEYPNCKNAHEICRKIESNDNICINNILELNEKDLKSWVGEAEWNKWIEEQSVQL